MQSQGERDRMVTVKDGYAVCPNCRRNNRLIQVKPGISAERVIIFCRGCKKEITLRIHEGQCFESRGQ